MVCFPLEVQGYGIEPEERDGPSPDAESRAAIGQRQAHANPDREADREKRKKLTVPEYGAGWEKGVVAGAADRTRFSFHGGVRTAFGETRSCQGVAQGARA